MGLERYPQNTTSPLGGTRLYNFNLCWVDVIAPKTESLLTRDLMFDAVPYSSASSFCTRGIWSLGGMMREIILVPFLNKRLAVFSFSRMITLWPFQGFWWVSWLSIQQYFYLQSTLRSWLRMFLELGDGKKGFYSKDVGSSHEESAKNWLSFSRKSESLFL